jgi:hypothetical protein
MEQKMDRMRSEKQARNKIIESTPHLLLIVNNPMTSGLYPSTIPQDRDTLCGSLDPRPDSADQGGVATASAPASPSDVVLKGAGVKHPHCILRNAHHAVTVIPYAGASTMINGHTVSEATGLQHNDRLRLGTDNWFRFVDPAVLRCALLPAGPPLLPLTMKISTTSHHLRRHTHTPTHTRRLQSSEDQERDQVTFSYEFLKAEAMEEAMMVCRLLSPVCLSVTCRTSAPKYPNISTDPSD